MKPYRVIRHFPGDGVCLAELEGVRVVVKSHPNAGIERQMLELLSPYLCVPKIINADAGWFAMEYLEEGATVDECEAAGALASLHRNSSERFGLGFDTTIGPHLQPNTFSQQWIPFYREQRVMEMARGCLERNRFDGTIMKRIERLCERFESLLVEPQPSLLHGDVWSGNVLSRKGKACFIDPAVYYGHNEVELAFIAMFHTFGKRFFEAYDAQFPIASGFFEERMYLYQLYPVLVHVRSFGGSYLQSLESILKRYE